jgi:DNA-binding NarL/FixJ family response regulator
VESDANGTCTLNVSQRWQRLAQGTLFVVDDFFEGERCYLVLEAKPASHGVEGRRLDILVAVLSGLRQKNIAIDLGLAPSTIALNSRLALQSLGLSCRPSRAHPLVMLAASSGREPSLTVARCATLKTAEGQELLVVGMPRPDRHLTTLLPSAELAVIRSLVEGLSYEEIAQQRGTSTRTIANQITAVFRRLRVSGRNELVQRLFFDETLGKHVPERAAQTIMPPSLLDTDPHGDRWEATRRSA